MFQRIEYTEWHVLFPKIGFVLFAAAFGMAMWRILRMTKAESDRASKLPLDE